MFKDNLLFKEEQEEIANSIVENFKPGTNIGNGLVICIFGISGTGKTEVAWWTSRKLYDKNFSSHIISLDRFYRIPVLDREDYRRRTRIIGAEEMDWIRIEEEIEAFRTLDKIDVLIVEGLYAGYIEPSNLRVYLEGTIESTYEFRKLRGKENPDSSWRHFILTKENDAVFKSLKDTDEIYKT